MFHSGGAATGPRVEIGGIVVACAERCAADALRWRDLAAALPAVFVAIRQGRVDPAAIGVLAASDDPRGKGAARARYAWGALATALGISASAPGGGSR